MNYDVDVGDGGSSTSVNPSAISNLNPNDTITFRNIALTQMTISGVSSTVFTPSGSFTENTGGTVTLTVVAGSEGRTDTIGCAVTGSSQTNFTASCTVPPPTVPGTPSGSFDPSTGQTYVSWAPSDNATGYTLYHQRLSGSSWVGFTSVYTTSTSYSTNHGSGSYRRYAVRAEQSHTGAQSSYSPFGYVDSRMEAAGTPSAYKLNDSYNRLSWAGADNAAEYLLYVSYKPYGGSYGGDVHFATTTGTSYDAPTDTDGYRKYKVAPRNSYETGSKTSYSPECARLTDSDPGSITGKLGNDIHDVVPSSYQYSDGFVVSGINTATYFTLTESPATGVDQSSVGASAVLFASNANHGTSGYIQPNESIYVRITASSQYGKWTEFILTLDGNRSDVIRVYTQTYDNTPSGFTTIGADKENQQFGSEHTYLYTVSGINVPISATISNGELKVNNGSYQTGTINNIVNGDDLTIKVTAPTTYNATKTCTFDLAEMPRKTRSIGTPYDVQFSYTAPYTLANVNGFFGGGPTLDGSYYRGFAVPDIPGNENFPANGSISMSQFIGTRKRGEFLA